MELSDIVENTEELPTLPTVATRINSELENDALTAKLLAEIISEDTSLAAKILRISNSAFYGMSREVTSVEKAVMILGFNAVKNLALSVSVYSFFEQGKDAKIDMEGMWQHSLATAVCAKNLVEKDNKLLGDDAFIMGVIHDIGKIVLINTRLADVETVYSTMAEKEISQEDAEKEVYGYSHQRVGALLLREWSFPEQIINGVRKHHNIPLRTTNMEPDTVKLVVALIIGNKMAKALSLGKSLNPGSQKIPVEMFNLLNIKHAELPEIVKNARESFSKILSAWQV